MKKFTLFYMVLVLAPNLFGSINAMNPKMAVAVNTMSMNFFKVALENEAGNFLCSPISIYHVLLPAYIGSSDNTHDEIRNTLQLEKEIKPENLDFLNIAMNISKDNFKMADKIFFNNNLKINPEFLEKLKKIKMNYRKLNLKNALMSAKIINDWVDKKTNHIIRDIISANDISLNSKLILVNTIYFKAEWLNQFASVYSALFHINENTSKTVGMMHLQAVLEIASSAKLGARIIKLPYITSSENDEKVSMIIITPYEFLNDGLKPTQMNINNFNLSSLEFKKHEVSLSLPKFKLETNINVKNYLEKMGMIDAFNENAEFPKITQNNGPMLISKIVQKAFINVDERGTEAGAATRAEAIERNLVPRFVVNRPFLAILATEHVILFAARINDPTLN